MIRLITPLILALAGAGIGIGAGLVLSIEPATQNDGDVDLTPESAEYGELENEKFEEATTHSDSDSDSDYVKLSNQFVIPVLSAGKVVSLVVISLALETAPETTDEIYRVEPKLRDAFLQVLFDHANIGGFDGKLTDGNALAPLRKALNEKAQKVLGSVLRNVLITEIVRQDV